MNKKSGVSLITLVITIVVILILAAVSFSASLNTVANANWSKFVSEMDLLKDTFKEASSTYFILGNKNRDLSHVTSQLSNYMAKGAKEWVSGDYSWLDAERAEALSATKIEKEYAKKSIGTELPNRKVNTHASTGVEIAYFVTNKGNIFCWPPFEHEGSFWVDNETQVISQSGDTKGQLITIETEEEMYKDGFTFSVNGVNIIVKDSSEPDSISSDISGEDLKNMPAIYYHDVPNAKSPKGIESNKMIEGKKFE